MQGAVITNTVIASKITCSRCGEPAELGHGVYYCPRHGVIKLAPINLDTLTQTQIVTVKPLVVTKQVVRTITPRLVKRPGRPRKIKPVNLVRVNKKIDRPVLKKHQAWSEEDLQYLRQNLGILSDEELSTTLGRSAAAIHVISVRKLKIKRTENIYTSTKVAKLLGITCPKTIVNWIDHGWLKAKRAPYCQGLNQVWSIDFENIVACLRLYPWLANRTKMPEHYFKELVQKEYADNPWYSLDEANKILGLRCRHCIPRYIKRGLLKAEKAPGAPHQGVWIIRKKDLEKFQEEKRV